MTTTPTGIPVTACTTCGKTHPVTRRHCAVCGSASVFARLDGRCLKCGKASETGRAS